MLSKDKKIAIIGCSFEFPDVKRDLESLWEGLLTQKCFYHNAFKEGDERVAAWGSVEDLKGFDYTFFGFSYYEACKIDPQHRHLLQHCWWAMENAGYMNKKQLPVTAVFASASENHYLWHNLAGELQPGTENETLLGNLPDFLATRIAWKLGTTGQALTIQCGCSSGLAGLHLARVALLTGQAEMALVGAVSLAAPHQKGYEYIPGGIRSANGQVRAFDHDASGTVFTNGVAALVLKPLQKALEHADNILGVVESSALNNDGGDKAGFTAPSVSGQSLVIRRAMRLAAIPADEIALYEAHGTGTHLGDPIEFSAINEAWADTVSTAPTCAIQSVKANLGHLDTVSGLAGVIKACLVLKHRKLPPQIHYQTPNSHIDLVGSPFFINTTVQSLADKARFASVSALGIGGTNAHVILSGAPDILAITSPQQGGLFLLSAQTAKALEALKQAWIGWKGDDNAIAKAAEITQQGRTAFRIRQSLWANSAEALLSGLKKQSQSAVVAHDAPVIVLMFTGQGSQYAAMGKHLYQRSSFFRNSLEEKLTILQQLSGDDYRSILFEQQEAIHQPQHTQPILLALEVALVDYLKHCGVHADLMLGHSLGEYSAIVAAQVLSFHDAARLVLRRAQLVQETQPGTMCSVMADIDTIRPLMEGLNVDVAALNSNMLSVISGTVDDIKRFIEHAEQHSIFCQLLKVKRAFHSHLVDPVLPTYRKALQDVVFAQPQTPIISTLTGSEIDISQLGQPDYWLRQMREPVLFADAVDYAARHSERLCFIEVGPGQTLKTLALQTVKHPCINLLPHPGEIEKAWQTLFTGFGQLWEQGVEVQWQNLRDPLTLPTCPPLPGYPFQPVECWVTPARNEVESLQRYCRCWMPRSEPIEVTDNEDINWLLFTDGSVSSTELAQSLSATFERQTKRAHIVRYEPHSCAAILKNYFPTNVALLLHPDAVSQEAFSPLLTVLTLVKSWQTTGAQQLRIITRSGIDFLTTPCPALAALASAVKSLNQEYPALTSRMIDFDGQDETLLTRELHASSPTIVALRRSERLSEAFLSVPTYEHTDADTAPSSVLILGGGGQVGLQYARTFLEKSQARVCLLQRSSLANLMSRNDRASQARAERIKALMKRWPDRLILREADVESQESLLAACRDIKNIIGSLDVLIHAAGIDASMHYQLIKDVEADFCHTSFAAKSRGLNNMAAVAEILQVPHCHVVSSISAALGGIGMYVYGSLHAWLDTAVAVLRRQHPSRWTLLNWEAWEFGNDDEIPEYFRQGAFGSQLNRYAMQPVQGRHFLWQCWNSLQGQHIISNTNLQQRYQEWVENQHDSSVPTTEEQPQHAPRPEMSREYCPAQNEIEKKIVTLWEALLGMSGIGIDDNFFELGGHSLMALRMTGQVNKSVQTTISMVDIFQYPTIRKLSVSITEKRDFNAARNEAALRAQKRRQAQSNRRA